MLTPRTQVLNAAGGIIQPEGGVITPATMDQILQLSQMGSGGGLLQGMGNLGLFISNTASVVQPAATGADVVIAVFSIPANSFDVAGRGIYFTAQGSFANNGHTKEVKIIFNPTTAVVGSTVGSGGTTIADTGAYSTSALTGFLLEAQVFKYGAANSNTQLGMTMGIILAGTHSGIGSGSAGTPTAITATENAAILVAVTANATTTASDISVNLFQAQAMN